MDERPPWDQNPDPSRRWADLPEARPDEDFLDLFYTGKPPLAIRVIRRVASFVGRVLELFRPY